MSDDHPFIRILTPITKGFSSLTVWVTGFSAPRQENQKNKFESTVHAKHSGKKSADHGKQN